MGSTRIDIAGQRYGRWLVLSYAETRGKQAYWRCKCDCGSEKSVSGGSLRSGGTESCGCLIVDVNQGNQHNRRHGHTTGRWHGQKPSPEYVSWQGMIARCENPKARRYERYGGRGITVCERWRKSFAAFLEDMGLKPTPKHTIERKDNDGNYEKNNCAWATAKQQAANRRKR